MNNRYPATQNAESCLAARQNDKQLQAPDGKSIKEQSREEPKGSLPKALLVSDESQYSSSGMISEEEATQRLGQVARIWVNGARRVVLKEKAARIQLA